MKIDLTDVLVTVAVSSFVITAIVTSIKLWRRRSPTRSKAASVAWIAWIVYSVVLPIVGAFLLTAWLAWVFLKLMALQLFVLLLFVIPLLLLFWLLLMLIKLRRTSRGSKR